jgi:hypothetical protein
MVVYISVGMNGVSKVFASGGSGISTGISFASARTHSESTSMLSYLVHVAVIAPAFRILTLEHHSE